MTTFQYLDQGNTEAQDKLATSFLLANSGGLATTGVLTGLAVSQNGTANATVNIAAGAGVVQDTVLNGAGVLVNDSVKNLDILTANPLGGLPRNDLVVFDNTTSPATIKSLIGTPNAIPTDPTVLATQIPLARIRNLASATTIPAAQIDDLRVKISLFGAADENNRINGVPFAGASVTKAAKRLHWASYTGTTDASGYVTFTHAAGFTPTVVSATPNAPITGSTSANIFSSALTDTFTSTQFRLRAINAVGAALASTSVTITAILGE